MQELKLKLDTERLCRLRQLSIVPRWTVVPTIQRQNVAEHSFHVAHIALWLAQYHTALYTGDYDRDILWYALIHDETEAITGDIPTPAGKKHLPGKSSLFESKHNMGTTLASTDVKCTLKIADLLEALLFTQEEERLGHKGFTVISHDILERLQIVIEAYHWRETCENYRYYLYFYPHFLDTYKPNRDPINEQT